MSKFNRLFILASATTLLALMTQGGFAHGAERGETKATIGGAQVSIDYGRPLLKGRDPLKMLKPGQVWRIGADASTTIESDKDLDFGGTKVSKGKHILLAQVDESGKWTLLASSKPWNQYESSAKIAAVPLTLEEAPDSVESVTIQLSGKDGDGIVVISWGKMRLSGSFRIAE